MQVGSEGSFSGFGSQESVGRSLVMLVIIHSMDDFVIGMYVITKRRPET